MASVPEGFELVDQPVADIPPGFELAGVEDVGDRRIDSGGGDTGGAGRGQALIQEIETAFQKIPGAPSLSEFAAASNRSVLDALDFLGADTINAILNVSGSDARIPTLRESLGSEGGFVEPGLQRDILQTAGGSCPHSFGYWSTIKDCSGSVTSCYRRRSCKHRCIKTSRPIYSRTRHCFGRYSGSWRGGRS